MNDASRSAPRWSPWLRTAFLREKSHTAMEMTMQIPIRMKMPSLFEIGSWRAGIRQGVIHGPKSTNAVGLPRKEAASTRNGIDVPGHTPVQAERASEVA